jgi:Ser/Thr protein kinase RdoA (MazF antagonist)
VASILAANGIGVVEPLLRADGTFAGNISLGQDPIPAIAYRHAEAEAVVDPTPEQAFRLGESIARLQDCDIDARDLPLVEPMTLTQVAVNAVARWLADSDARWLRAVVATALRECDRVDLREDITLLHGDLCLANARFVGSRPTLLDLENLGIGPGAYDSACLWRKRFLENDLAVPSDWNDFKRGYESVRAVDERHWALVPPLAVLRAVWTMSLPVLPSTGWGTDWARDPEYWSAHLEMVRALAEAANLEA